MSWENVVLAFFATLPATLAAIASLIASLRNAGKIEAVSGKLQEVEKQTNGELGERIAKQVGSKILTEAAKAARKLKSAEMKAVKAIGVAEAAAILKLEAEAEEKRAKAHARKRKRP